MAALLSLRSTMAAASWPTIGGAKVSQPAIDLKTSFTAAALAAGLIGAHQTFDPFAN